jgi:rhodanese-related sulfurtransferase
MITSESLSMLYAGELSPTEAFEYLKNDPAAQMVDVRTVAEWSLTGYPDLSSLGKSVIKLSWRLYPTMQINSEFADQLAREIPDLHTPLLFMCKIGGRSLDAAIAMTALGYTRCYNITDGFEGSMDAAQHRGTVSGWKAENLPWEQN